MRAWRSELATPGSNPRMMEKAIASAADVAFLDLEDAVSSGEKDGARRTVIAALTGGAWGDKPRAYRVNALDTSHFYRDLIDVIEGAEGAVDLVVVPKVDSPEDVYVVDTLLRQIEARLGLRHRIELEVQIETAKGLVNCERIAVSSSRIAALTFGPGDFAASAGMPATQIGMPDAWDAAYPGHRWHYAMSRIVVAARAAGVIALDGPFADFRDLDGVRASAMTARALGFDGKWCIHPAQIPIVNEVFTPAEAEISWARRVVEAATDAAASGAGSLQIDGRMVDGANVRMAQRTLELLSRQQSAGST